MSDLPELLELLEREIANGRVDLPLLDDARDDEELTPKRAATLAALTAQRAEQLEALTTRLQEAGAESDAVSAATELRDAYVSHASGFGERA